MEEKSSKKRKNYTYLRNLEVENERKNFKKFMFSYLKFMLRVGTYFTKIPLKIFFKYFKKFQLF